MNFDIINMMLLLYLFYFFSLSVACFSTGFGSQCLTDSAAICIAGLTAEFVGTIGEHEGGCLNSIFIVQLATSQKLDAKS